MNKRSSAPARVFAVITLVIALVVADRGRRAALSVAGTRTTPAGNGHGKAARHARKQKRENIPATYEVKSGDTLISIAHHNGVTGRTASKRSTPKSTRRS